MIPVCVDSVIFPGNNEVYPSGKVCHINPNLVCAVKPALFVEDMEDIMTADGMVYRVHWKEPNLRLIKSHDRDMQDYRTMELMLGNADIRFTNEVTTEGDPGK